MKVLSIKQPWASLIALGIKPIENRSWKTNFRGRIYIHASAKVVNVAPIDLLSTDQRKEVLSKYHKGVFPWFNPVSAIIGEVDIIDCVMNHPSIWAEKGKVVNTNGYGHTEKYKPIYNWVLANPVSYDNPILNVKGKLSFWEFIKP